MLGRLIQGSRGITGLESTTEETHTRGLLFPTQHDAKTSFSSPPITPIGSPTFRVGPFDDRGGLELNENKVRIIVAQDALGTMDRGLLLFDSQHQPAKGDAQPPQTTPQQRLRSSTVSGLSANWSRPTRESESNDKVNRLLDCMFGASSASMAKRSESSTKMHVLFSTKDSQSSPSQPSPTIQKSAPVRAPLLRSRTSNPPPATPKSPTPASDETAEDVILITRMFTVLLPESKEPVRTATGESLPEDPQQSPTRSDSFGTGKRPKLVEKRIPSFGIGILLTMPAEEVKAAFSRPPSRTSLASSSFPNSFGSDIASSWTFLESISGSLGSSAHSHKHADKRIEFVTNIWDVMLRCLTCLELSAKEDIRSLLQQVNREIMASIVKTPKGPREQRTNQRNVYIRQPYALESIQNLRKTSHQVIQRISFALKIPRVTTGMGFVDGHWLDEARYLVNICGTRTQNYFFFSLLTAFLGNHTEWLETMGVPPPQDAHPKEARPSPNSFLANRTVLIAERRSIARRLIFLLASFLPTPSGVNALDKGVNLPKSPLHTPGLPISSSPLKQSFSAAETGLDHRRQRNQHVSFGAADAVALSTSVSSTASAGPSEPWKKTRPGLSRVDSDAASIRTASGFPIGANTSLHLRKASAANSAATPYLTHPTAYISAKSDSYFPEDAIADGSESAASADLARILRRDSSSLGAGGMPSPKWPALLTGFWPKRQDTGDSNSPKFQNSRSGSPEMLRRGSVASTTGSFHTSGGKLLDMVSEANGVDVPRPRNSAEIALPHDDIEAGLTATSPDPPRLHVDEEDGVVDVDVDIPGFLSWEDDSGPVSPPKKHNTSTSLQSLSGAVSGRSSISHANDRVASRVQESASVAGFLKYYHEDFTLQAVKPYDELQEDIKQSMIRESSLLDEDALDSPNYDITTAGEWTEVCSTIVADLRRFTIERIILRRKKKTMAKDDLTSAQQPSLVAIEHSFITEQVMNVEAKLREAIEGLLETISRRQGPNASNSRTSHQRNISTSTTASAATTTPPSSLSIGFFGRQNRPQLQANCRQVVADALEEVVKSVKDDLHVHDARAMSQKQNDDVHEPEENVLREGVRKWLLNEETRAVW
jgi:hypothetical protein